MKVVSNLAWGILKYIGISRTEDLPPIPDAPMVKTPS